MTIKKMMKYNGEMILFAVLVQASLMILAVPAYSYQLSGTNSVSTPISVNQKSNIVSKVLGTVGSLLIAFLTIKQFGMVSAESAGTTISWCCKSSCTSLAVGYSGSLCSSGSIAPQSCSQVPSCQRGTCLDSAHGSCSPNTAESTCKAGGGQWSSGSMSQVSACQYVCCNLGGTDEQWMYRTQCSLEHGSTMSGVDQADCVATSPSQGAGACVLPNGYCQMTIPNNCPISKGLFYANDLCTNPHLHTICAPTENTQCYNNDVYFTDNCSNIANVYNANMMPYDSHNQQIVNYWSYINYQGKPTCDSSDPSSCGLCNYPDVSQCSLAGSGSTQPKDGSYICKNLQCDVSNNPFFPSAELGGTTTALNGESWCAYTNYTGNLSKVYNSGKSIQLGCYPPTTGSAYLNCPFLSLNNGPGSSSSDSLNSLNCQPSGSSSGEFTCQPSGSAPGALTCYDSASQSGSTFLNSISLSCDSSGNCGATTGIFTCLNTTSDQKSYTCNPVSSATSGFNCQSSGSGSEYNCMSSGASAVQLSCKLSNSNSEVWTYSAEPAGSYSLVQYCDNGVVAFDNSSSSNDEYRYYLCRENISAGYSNAKSIINNGPNCLTAKMESYYDSQGNPKSNTEEVFQSNENTCGNLSQGGGPDCRLQSVDVSKYFKFDICVPKYPIAFQLVPSSKVVSAPTPTQAEQICHLGNATCVTVWANSPGGWHCQKNCNCLTKDFADQMNNLCVSLGDCGGFVNINGDYTTNYQTFNYKDSNQMPSNYKDKSAVFRFRGGDQYDLTQGGIFGGGDGSILSDLQNFYISNMNKQNVLVGSGRNVPGFLFKNSTAQDTYTNAGTYSGPEVGQTYTQIVGIFWGAIEAAGVIVAIFNPVLGGVISTVAALLQKVTALFGWQKTATLNVNFVCNPWHAPSSNTDCNKCGTFGLPCTAYQCESLGACQYVQDIYNTTSASTFSECKPIINAAPNITFGSAYPASDYKVSADSSNKNGETINASDGGCILEGSDLNFSVISINANTGVPQLSRCVWNYTALNVKPTDYSSGGTLPIYNLQANQFLENTYYSSIWNLSTTLPYISQLPITQVQGDTPGKQTASLSIYILCESVNGNANIPGEFKVNLCIKSRPDTGAAEPYTYTPANNSYLTYQQTNTSLHITLNKPANCSYSFSASDSYSDMTPMGCLFDNLSRFSGGDCYTNITGLSTTSENDIYILCKTHPWDNSGVINKQPWFYVLRPTTQPLNISSVVIGGYPAGPGISAPTLTGPGSYVTEDLTATTSGGAYGGESRCSYSIPGQWGSGFFSDAQQTNTYHTQDQISFVPGKYHMLINCSDDAGNTASEYVDFNIQTDNQAPTVTRVYHDASSNTLNIITDEYSKCYYSTSGCGFDIDGNQSIAMDSIFTTNHSTSWNSGITYYVKCIDYYNNVNSGCAATISPSYF